MASRNNFQANLPEFYQSQSNLEKKHFAWEPYAISTPRKLLTEEEINQQKREKKIDQVQFEFWINKKNIDLDFIDAYLTYSPYRTSNQEYGARKPNIHFINREEKTSINDLSQDSRNVFSQYSSSTTNPSSTYAGPTTTTSKTGFP